MADSRDSLGGCFGLVAVLAVIGWFATKPANDQVCRNSRHAIFDRLHGVQWQPTCQQLIDQLDAGVADARRKERELEDRISVLEEKLGT